MAASVIVELVILLLLSRSIDFFLARTVARLLVLFVHCFIISNHDCNVIKVANTSHTRIQRRVSIKFENKMNIHSPLIITIAGFFHDSERIDR